jgi:hypothetical protein
MKTVAILEAKPHQRLTIHTTPSIEVLGYVIAVDQWKGTRSIYANWRGTDAEGATGVGFELEPADGYDIVIKATVRNMGTPHIDFKLELDRQVLWSDTVGFPSAEGPVVTRDWSVFLRSEQP